MRLALRLAERGRGRVEPNPMVGAVIVRRGAVIGRGWHKRFGAPHAEVNAIADAGGNVAASTVYVTLEPCAHFGKTPPCADLLIRHKVKRVVVACRDIFPPTAGKGIRALRRAGIEVEVGPLADEARELNAPFFKLVGSGIPFVIAKWAMTLDGKIATKTGESKWISSPEAREFAHRLRSQADGVIVGIGTVLADDPELTCRLVRGRHPRRIVLDTLARLPLDSRLVKTAALAPLVVAVSERAPRDRVRRLMERGCGVVVFPTKRLSQRVGPTFLSATRQAKIPAAPAIETGSKPRAIDVMCVLRWLGAMRITNVLVEGGGEVLGSFADAGQIDEVVAFIGPKIVGGAGKPPVLGAGVAKFADALHLGPLTTKTLGDTVLLHARVVRK